MRPTSTSLVLVLLGFWASVSGAPQEGGEYVDPKIGVPQEDGEYMEPKIGFQPFINRVTCGGKLELDVGEKVILRNPDSPKEKRCRWEIKGKASDSTLEVDCPTFNMPWSKRCGKERLMLNDKKEMKKALCGQGEKKFTTQTNELAATFLSKRKKASKGFECTVRSVRRSSDSTASWGTTADKPATTKPTTKPTTKAPASGGGCTCGVSNPTRIVNGVEVSPAHKYPWHGGLKFSSNANYWCGATIICSRYAITAAHCFFDDDGNQISDTGLVMGVGDHDMSTTSDDVSGVTRLVSVKVIVHPNYVPEKFDYDVALLRLAENLDLSKSKEVRAVCLPKDDSKTYAGATGIAAGWGTLSSGGSQPNKLMEVTLPILEPSCWKKNVSERMLCAGYEAGGKDTCQGDSGGPLYVVESSKYFQVGVTSFGNGCANANSPGVYARVTKFLPWIKENTADATYCSG